MIAAGPGPQQAYRGKAGCLRYRNQSLWETGYGTHGFGRSLSYSTTTRLRPAQASSSPFAGQKPCRLKMKGIGHHDAVKARDARKRDEVGRLKDKVKVREPDAHDPFLLFKGRGVPVNGKYPSLPAQQLRQGNRKSPLPRTKIRPGAARGGYPAPEQGKVIFMRHESTLRGR